MNLNANSASWALTILTIPRRKVCEELVQSAAQPLLAGEVGPWHTYACHSLVVAGLDQVIIEAHTSLQKLAAGGGLSWQAWCHVCFWRLNPAAHFKPFLE